MMSVIADRSSPLRHRALFCGRCVGTVKRLRKDHESEICRDVKLRLHLVTKVKPQSTPQAKTEREEPMPKSKKQHAVVVAALALLASFTFLG
jgi:hypothetical protein